jgi:Mg-chelatase subunit ChlD
MTQSMSDLKRFKLKMPDAPVRGQLTSGGRGDGTDNQRPKYDDVVREYASSKARESRTMLLVDATGSMAHHWDHLRVNLEGIVERLLPVGGRLRLKFVAYRDDCDGDRLIEQSAWQNDATKLKEFIAGLHCDGGGDRPEAVDRALRVALDDQDGVTSVVLIGDAPPHAQRGGETEAAALAKRNIPVYSIVVGGAEDTRSAFAEISRLSGGKTIELAKLDELYDVLGVVLARGMGDSAFREYVNRYHASLGSGATAAARLLAPGGGGRS